MDTAIDVVLFVIGVSLVVVAMTSAIKSTILPRAVRNRLVTLVVVSVRVIFQMFLRHADNYERRDRVMGFYGPATLIAELVTWMALILIGYSLMFLAIETSSVKRAVELSGSSVTTIGTSASAHLATQLLTYSEAGLGLVLLTLLITYLPSIYQSFSRRENGVGFLAVRAGSPPSAITMLIRYHRIEDVNYRLTELWRTWEAWFVDVEETHSSYPVLAFFRSPRSNQSSVNSAGVLLDAASLWLSAIKHDNDPDAQLCIRAGFLSLVGSPQLRDSRMTQIRRPMTPSPLLGLNLIMPMTRWPRLESASGQIREQAWIDFSGWRVNYDRTAQPCPLCRSSPYLGSRIAVHCGLSNLSLRQAAATRLARTSPRTRRGATATGMTYYRLTPAIAEHGPNWR